jgi:hypothetical protein
LSHFTSTSSSSPSSTSYPFSISHQSTIHLANYEENNHFLYDIDGSDQPSPSIFTLSSNVTSSTSNSSSSDAWLDQKREAMKAHILLVIFGLFLLSFVVAAGIISKHTLDTLLSLSFFLSSLPTSVASSKYDQLFPPPISVTCQSNNRCRRNNEAFCGSMLPVSFTFERP